MYSNLRCLSHYSRFESVITIKDLVKYSKDLNLDHCVLCDRMNLFGAVEFTQHCIKNKIKPILGCILKCYLGECCVFIANEEGYKNLSFLLSEAHMYYKGLVTETLLEKYNEGLICIGTKKELIKYFPNRFYFEFYDEKVLEKNKQWIIDENVPIVYARNINYLTTQHKEAFDVFTAIGNTELKYETHKFITPKEKVTNIQEAIDNTFNITRRCSFLLEPVETKFPQFSNNLNISNEEFLRKITLDKLQKLVVDKKKYNIYYERLNKELDVICNKGFATYFLVTQDFVQFAVNNNIPVGPGRGSGSGSLVAYLLGITNIDPMEFNLIFERFLNPERASNPDFDIDFCPERRKEVIDYVREKYGRDKVAYIITFGTLQARGVLKDVGRVLGMSHKVVDNISKLIPLDQVNPVNLSQAIEKVNTLKLLYSKPENKKLFSISLQLEGLCRNYSKHAAGIIIADQEIPNYCPLYLDEKEDVITQFNMKFIEYVGLIKFDFLGLRNLSIIDNTIKLIGNIYNRQININKIKLDDKKTFLLFQKGDLEGVFQFEGKGVKEVMKKLKPTHIEDLIAVNALYRPGPIKHIPTYINRKHKLEQVKYPHPLTEKILSNTFGVIIYQEQVMDIAVQLASYTLSEADNLRRAMGKKKHDVMIKEKEKFLTGCKNNNIPSEVAINLFKDMEEFAGYAFNRAHAATYGIIGYQCAYLKANYLKEYLVSIINEEKDNKEKIVCYLHNLKENNISILPPCVNKSKKHFTIEGDAIRYGFVGIKGVGELLMEQIEEKQPYESIEHFINSHFHLLNKKNWQFMVYSGMLDVFSNNRADVLNKLQNSDLLIDTPVTKWDQMETFKNEQEAFGFYFNHPGLFIEKKFNVKFDSIDQYVKNKKTNGIMCVELLTIIRRKRNDNQFAFIKFIDHSAMLEINISSNILEKYEKYLKEKAIVIVNINSTYYGNNRHYITNVVSLDEYLKNKKNTQSIVIPIEFKKQITTVKKILDQNQGSYGIFLKIHGELYKTYLYGCPKVLQSHFIDFYIK